MPLLALSVFLFGAAWPVMKVGLGDASPVAFAAARAGLGALAAFLLLALIGRLRLPRWRDVPIILSIGGLQLGAFFALVNLALRFIPPGRSSVLVYTTGLWLVPMAALAGEPIGALRLAGVACGLAGIAVMIDPFALDWRQGGVLIGHFYLLLAALAWAIAIFHSRHHSWRLSPLELLPWQLLLAAVLLVPLTRVIEPNWHIGHGLGTLGALAYLGVLGGPLATWAATSVARALPTIVSSVAFLGTPVLGTILSAIFLGERLDAAFLLGGGLVLGGVALVALGGEAVLAGRRRAWDNPGLAGGEE